MYPFLLYFISDFCIIDTSTDVPHYPPISDFLPLQDWYS